MRLVHRSPIPATVSGHVPLLENEDMNKLFGFLLRLVLIAAGLLFAASLAVVVLLLAALWGLRYLWARLTGQPVLPFVMRVDPRGGFNRMYRARQQGARTDHDGPPAAPGRERNVDVTDVEPKLPRG